MTDDFLRRTAQAYRDEITARFGNVTQYTLLENAIEDLTPFQAAYSRQYAAAFEQLELHGVSPQDVLGAMQATALRSDAAFERGFRAALRSQIVAQVRRLEPADQLGALEAFYDGLPNGFQGSLFSAFRSAAMDDAGSAPLTQAPPAPRNSPGPVASAMA